MSEDLRPTGRPLSSDELNRLADAWIRYWYAPKGSPIRYDLSDATDLYELQYHNPEDLWNLILLIHGRDQSNRIQEVLSAGPVEDLLVKHGDSFIDRIETQARLDPKFAKLLGGVWKNRMSGANWNRLQAVWDRRGWDGVPE
jgi:glycerophosphoryl diester phosphodiesterase